ncbi:uncharacterized protein VTP21DRAFT_1685 [Calcarisporiella thermophila]|uniref:uncharacterized protein n=1 Tax=Calcarisporiella thermophila TaxID=911321 RepID=UPI0037434FE3
MIPKLTMLYLLLLLIILPVTIAHEHHDDMLGDLNVSSDPVDGILIAHIIVQILAWAFVFPLGMILGLTRSRWHVPLQIAGTALTAIGIFLGHMHGGRQFREGAHSSFGGILIWILGAQVIFGIYLKLHLERGEKWIHVKLLRPTVKFAHSLFGKAFPIVGYTQIVLGVITSVGFCYEDHFGQCLAHFIMGSSFIAYGVIMILLLRVGGPWLRRKNKSPEWYDSWVIMLWGIVNTFTEHRWNQEPWSHGDMQHTSLGILWWAGGLAGIFLSRRGNRSIIPAIVIIFTGYSMVGHAQHSEYSLKLHSLFGYVLSFGALARIVEICFVVKREDTSDSIHPFQHLPPFLLILAGYMFMGANEEQVHTFEDMMVDVSSYANVLISFAFITFLYTHGLISLWQHSGKNAEELAKREMGRITRHQTKETTIISASESFNGGEFEEELEMGLLENEGK